MKHNNTWDVIVDWLLFSPIQIYFGQIVVFPLPQSKCSGNVHVFNSHCQPISNKILSSTQSHINNDQNSKCPVAPHPVFGRAVLHIRSSCLSFSWCGSHHLSHLALNHPGWSKEEGEESEKEAAALTGTVLMTLPQGWGSCLKLAFLLLIHVSGCSITITNNQF